jgi:alcohol dehydrogenase (cytochrome c)
MARRRRGEGSRWTLGEAGAEAAILLLFVALLVPAVVVGYVIGDNGHDKTETVVVGEAQAARQEQAAIKAAPAFAADDLNADPGDDWITNGGSLKNQRYSPLDEIDSTNVSQLKGVWMTHLAGAGVAAKYSQEAQPLVYDGVVYVPTGNDDVFAVSVDSGLVLWHYEAKLDATISTVCCGWESRGVAIGDGKVFIGQLDGKLVALDQKTGEPVWHQQVARWQDGGTITSAPLYYDGRVYTGVSGGEFGIRGRLTAYDAGTGKEAWRFYTIPGPGEKGHDTWPDDEQVWKHGGAPIWQTPAVDPELGLIFFSTGNASNDLDGSKRPGDNLFTASIVAIDAKTGKYRWHFQQVHHDIWDYDSPSPVVLFDHDGKKGIGQPSKTGWLYLLNREDGKPLVPITEKAVPQDERQKTSPTQPFPSNEPFVAHHITDEQFAAIEKIAVASAKGKEIEVENGKEIFAPPKHGVYTVVTPGAQGGNNWPPSSYNPKTNLFYVCAQSTAMAAIAGSMEHEAKQGDVPPANFGSVFATTGFAKNPGTLTAIEATTGKIVWQRRWVGDSCYSGTTTTAGNLVFVGRNGGELQAYDARDGKRLWSFQTGAGANNTATVFERDGKEYVVFLAGGNSLAGTPHGDNLWLFSLDGTKGPVAAGGASTAVEHAGEAGESEPATPNQSKGKGGNAAAGATVFAENCSVCHGANGKGGNGGPDLTSIPAAKDFAKVVKQVANGGGGMPAFKGQLNDAQIDDVAAYVTQTINGQKPK